MQHAPAGDRAAARYAAGHRAGAYQGADQRIADAEERRQVERMYDELIATGTVEKTLPEDDRTVQDLHAAEVLIKKAAQTRAFQGASPSFRAIVS